MGNRARNQIKLFPEYDFFEIIPKKSKTANFAVILRLTRDISVLKDKIKYHIKFNTN